MSGLVLDEGAVDEVGVVDMIQVLSCVSKSMVGRIAAAFTVMLSLGCDGGNQGPLPRQEAGHVLPELPTKFVIHLSNVPAEAKVVAVAMFADEATYLSENANYSRSKPFDGDEGGTATITLDDVLSGSYAVIALADTDGDERLTTNSLGLPTEYFGFGNDAIGFFGPASFSDALVEVRAPITEINIRFVPPPFGKDTSKVPVK
jgi:uncharacterized protein (DUF2141 family)